MQHELLNCNEKSPPVVFMPGFGLFDGSSREAHDGFLKRDFFEVFSSFLGPALDPGRFPGAFPEVLQPRETIMSHALWGLHGCTLVHCADLDVAAGY